MQFHLSSLIHWLWTFSKCIHSWFSVGRFDYNGALKSHDLLKFNSSHCTEVQFASFFSSWFITAIVVNTPERRLAKRTSVHWLKLQHSDWRANLVKDFFFQINFSPIKVLEFEEKSSKTVQNYWRICKIIIWDEKYMFYSKLRWIARECAGLRWDCAGLRCLVHPFPQVLP